MRSSYDCVGNLFRESNITLYRSYRTGVYQPFEASLPLLLSTLKTDPTNGLVRLLQKLLAEIENL